MLVHLRSSGKTICIDYRETAPRESTPGMYREDENGEVVGFENSMGHKAVAVPGTLAGLTYALDNYGTMKFRDVAERAIEHANSGFEVSNVLGYIMAYNLDNARKKLQLFRETGRIWAKGGRPSRVGETLRNPELARALALVGEEGPAVFYRGELGRMLVNEMKANGGLVDEEDLAQYRVKVREPVRGRFRGLEVRTMPPPSGGGIAIIAMLNIFENLDLAGTGHNTVDTLNLMAKVMGLVFPLIGRSVADPDFVDVPTERLTSESFANKLWLSESGRGSLTDLDRQNWTTHISVVDKERNVTALTESLECFFGAGVTIPGAGILLNDTMHDFDTKPGGINSIQPGKRPRSNMAPTLLLKDGEPFLVAGSAGGPRIVTATLQTILNVVEHGMDINSSVNSPRIHAQRPGMVRVENGLPEEVRNGLRAMGLDVVVPNFAQVTPGFDLYFGGVQSVLVGEDGLLYAAADVRRMGAAAAC